jgi:glycosyltransferase involved in cell wall biosynthesis
MRGARLAVIETHPIQYHAPLYRLLEQELQIPVTAIYGSDFSVAGYADAEFGATFRWDTDLLSGYDARFLERAAEGGARDAGGVRTRGLGAALAEADPAAVMLVGYSPRFHREAFWKAWRGGYRLLFRGETTDHSRQRNIWKRTARAMALRALYARCAALLYVGKHSRAHFDAMGVPAARLFFSPYCVDTTPFRLDQGDALRAATRAEHDLQDRTVILFAGKLSRRKGTDLLVEGIRKLGAARQEGLALCVMGDGAMRDELETRMRELPAVQTVMAGFQNQTQLSRYYHAADVLALPSREEETWGLVVNEAMHHGVVCVVSDRVGCAPDLVTPGETGEVFGAGDADALAGALGRALEYCRREEHRAACKRRAEEYSMRRAAEGIARAFEKGMQAR